MIGWEIVKLSSPSQSPPRFLWGTWVHLGAGPGRYLDRVHLGATGDSAALGGRNEGGKVGDGGREGEERWEREGGRKEGGRKREKE